MVETAALVVAAGRGRRLGGPTPKALVPLGETPLVARAAAAVAGMAECLVVAVPPGWEGAFRRALPPAARIVVGGERRQDSVAAALAAVPAETAWVLVHDAARPLASPALAARVLAAARAHRAAVPVVPVTSTVKRVRGGEGEHIQETLPREELRLSQTPQGFARELLAAALERAAREGRTVPDEAAAVEALGVAVAAVPGEAANVKITTRTDLAWAEAWLRLAAEAR